MTQERTDEDVVRDAIHCACTVAKWDEFEIEPLEWNVCEGHAALDRLVARQKTLDTALRKIAFDEGPQYHWSRLQDYQVIARAALAAPIPEELEGAE